MIVLMGESIECDFGWVFFAEAKACTDDLLAGRSATLSFPSASRADDFCAKVQSHGALARRETRYR